MSTSTSFSNAPGLVQQRRKSQVFVEIPPSPLFKSQSRVAPYKVDQLPVSHKPESHKENAVPLSTKNSLNNLPADAKSKGKRKFQDDGDANSTTKKVKFPKVDDGDTLVSCHQCRSKKKPNVVLQCTSNLKATGKRCKATYCDTCLKNRYGEQLDAISRRKLPESREGHDEDTTYHFTCPRCEGFCNCAPCRKKNGLAPVGKFASAKEGESVREILEKNPQASGLLPKNAVMPVPKTQTAASSKASVNTEQKRPRAKPKEKSDDSAQTEKKKKSLKVMPEPVWVHIPHANTKQEMEDRIYLREFILRFNPILSIGPKILELLDDFTSLHDQSTKAVLIALLELLAIENDVQKKKIQAKVKKIRGLGLNWSSIVPVLYDLRDSLPEDHALHSLPNVDQSIATSYNTRGARMQGLSADQLLPLLLYLIDIAVRGASVRDELEEGNKQAKEVRAAHYKALRGETERWAAEKAVLTEDKSTGENDGKSKLDGETWKAKYRKAELEHKAIVANLQNFDKADMDGCTPRFAALGIDMDGRTYYILSASGPQRGKKERLPSEGERSSMKRFGWFVAVWGKPGSVVQQEEDAMKENKGEEDPNAEGWWGFAEVQEMRKLSKWLAYRAEAMPGKKHGGKGPDTDEDGTNLSQPATQAGVKALARGVLEFADFIGWRLGREAGLM